MHAHAAARVARRGTDIMVHTRVIHAPVVHTRVIHAPVLHIPVVHTFMVHARVIRTHVSYVYTVGRVICCPVHHHVARVIMRHLQEGREFLTRYTFDQMQRNTLVVFRFYSKTI